MKKKEKKRFTRTQLRISNTKISNIDESYDENLDNKKISVKKTVEKSIISSKKTELIKARVVEIHSNNRCKIYFDNKIKNVTIGGHLKQSDIETRTILSIGDFVNVDKNCEHRIEEILPRKNSFYRIQNFGKKSKIMIASNIDQIVITCSYIHPRIKFGLIDRYLCMAKINNIDPIVCVNKIDLINFNDEMKKEFDFYKKNGIKIIYTSIINKNGLDELKEILKNKETVFSGQSGAGKSSLINSIYPTLNLKVAKISEYNEKGRHTTTSSKLISLEGGGFIVDTPGIKTFSLNLKDKYLIPQVYPGFNDLFPFCKFNDCTHIHESECRVKKMVEEDLFPLKNYQSYVNIFESLK